MWWPLVFVTDMIDFTAIKSMKKINPTTELALFWHRVTILGYIYIYDMSTRGTSHQGVELEKNVFSLFFLVEPYFSQVFIHFYAECMNEISYRQLIIWSPTNSSSKLYFKMMHEFQFQHQEHWKVFNKLQLLFIFTWIKIQRWKQACFTSFLVL